MQDKPLSDAECDELLSSINQIALDVCHYEFGVPLQDDAARENLRNVVREWYNERTINGAV